MEIDIQVEGKTIVASVRGRADAVSAQAFEKELSSIENLPRFIGPARRP